MTRKIRIRAGSVEMLGELNDSKTGQAVYEVLPLKEEANTWGEEIYFSIPVKAQPDNPQETVEMGDLGYWPAGSAFCIFFGPTPVSKGEEIRPASPVNIIGRVSGDPRDFLKVRDGEKVTIEEAAD